MARVFAAGVNGMFLIGTNLHESQQALKLAQHYPHCRSTADVHPYGNNQWQSSTEDEIIVLTSQPEVVVVSECGLNFNRDFSTSQEQKRAFEAQPRIAVELQMPIFMYCRDAHERSLILLEPWLGSLPSAVLHCFTGTRQEVQDCTDRRLYVGITGWVCDERHGMELRELLPSIPMEKLLIGTDAPYLLPRGLAPKPTSRRNEPAHLLHILECIAHRRGEGLQWLSAITGTSVRTLFEVTF